MTIRDLGIPRGVMKMSSGTVVVVAQPQGHSETTELHTLNA